jgi:hypothetical protein
MPVTAALSFYARKLTILEIFGFLPAEIRALANLIV